MLRRGLKKAEAQDFRICQTRTVKRYAWFTADSEAAAIAQAQEVDENESDWEGWEIEDSDPGKFEVVERGELPT